jgi:hypothetical protein
MLRHPALRSAISVTAGPAPVQQVSADGTLPIPVHRMDDPFAGDPGDLRDLVPATTFASVFRALFAVRGGSVIRIAMRICHLAADADGARILRSDLAALAAGAPEAGPGDSVSPSPLDLFRFEESGEGRRVQRRSLEHAAAIYDVAPPAMFPRCRVPEPARFWFGQLRSANLLSSMDTLKDQGVTRAGALLGALAAATALRTGQKSALLFLISSNRFDPAWTFYPGLLTQEAILHLPVGETVRKTMLAATAASVRSLRKSRYSPAEMDKVRRAAEDRRAVSFDKLGSAVVLNLLPAGGPGTDVPRTPTTFEWVGETNAENLGLYIDAFADPAGFVLGARVDTARLAPDEAEALLREMEWMIIAAASRDAGTGELDSRVRRPARAPGGG